VSGPSAKASEEDQERTRRLADAEMHRHHLESLLDQRDREINALREVMCSTTTGDTIVCLCGYVFYCLLSYIHLKCHTDTVVDSYTEHPFCFDPTGAASSV